MSVKLLRHKLDRMIASIDRVPDWQVGKMVEEDGQESLFRKLAIFQDRSLTGEQRTLRYQQVSQEIDARHTPNERQAIANFRKKYAHTYAGAKDQLIAKLTALKGASV